MAPAGSLDEAASAAAPSGDGGGFQGVRAAPSRGLGRRRGAALRAWRGRRPAPAVVIE